MVVLVAVAYLSVGVVAAVAARTADPGRRALLVGLWPFLLPAQLAMAGAAEPSPPPLARATRAARAALVALPAAPPDGLAAIDRFEAVLRARAARVEELEQAVRGGPDAVRDRLAELAESERRLLDEGLAVLEDLTAQLTLLRFSASPAGSGEDGASVQDLLLRVQSELEVAQQGA